MDAAHYLGVYDLETIYSWTPRQFNNLIKGARLREVDEIERSAMAAMFNARAANGKVTVKKLFDAEKARRQVLSVDNKKQEAVNLDRYYAMKKAKGYDRPQNSKKGG